MEEKSSATVYSISDPPSFPDDQFPDRANALVRPRSRLYRQWRQQWSKFTEPEDQWNPSWRQVGPILALLALACAAAAMAGALAVLVVSDEQPVDSWPVSPTVYLAIASAIGVSALRFAKARATQVAWWQLVLRGTTVQRLESYWQAGQSLTSAISRIHHAGYISMATLITLLMIIDGALLQRASTVRTRSVSSPVKLNLLLAPELPLGFGGYFDIGTALNPSDVSKRTAQDAAMGTPMTARYYGCEHNARCTATILGPGVYEKNCTSQSWPITQSMLSDPDATWGTFHGPNPNYPTTPPPGHIFLYNPLFVISVAPYLPPAGTSSGQAANISIGLGDWGPSGGRYIQRNCLYGPAILKYKVQFENSQVSLLDNGTLYAIANNTISKPYNVGNYSDTMDALSWFTQDQVSANATAVIPSPAIPGNEWGVAEWTLSETVSKYYLPALSDPHRIFIDPLPDIVSQINRLMFRGGLLSAHWEHLNESMDPGLSANQTHFGIGYVQETIFHSDLRWFAGAAVLDLLAILALLPLLWGFWRLPRDLGQSPFDMALAFNAPLVSAVNPGSGARGVVSKLGDTPVAFGFVKKRTESDVSDNEAQEEDNRIRRLGIAKSTDIARPFKGARIDV